jgi:hypothetical protein
MRIQPIKKSVCVCVCDIWAAKISGTMSAERRAVRWRLIYKCSLVQNLHRVTLLRPEYRGSAQTVENFVHSSLKIPRKSDFLVVLRGYGI